MLAAVLLLMAVAGFALTCTGPAQWRLTEQERVRVTERRMNDLARAVAARARDAGVLPASLGVVMKVDGRSLSTRDGWEHPIRYVHATSPGRMVFALASPGSDGVFDAATRELLATSAHDVDGLLSGVTAVQQSAPRVRQPWYEAARADYVYLGPMKVAGYSFGSTREYALPPGIWMPRVLGIGMPSTVALVMAVLVWRGRGRR
ncbi:MAG: hypothetical protein JWN02_372 [Acidobacteria bacterium]|nr:hypothetical protein [Acidobacteriota bacterium]